ncbi:MAG: aminopeptidase P family protein [Bryobacteraceae bacterium]
MRPKVGQSSRPVQAFFRNLLACAIVLSAAVGLAADGAIWKIAPPPPASWQSGRIADLTARRQAAAAQIGPNGILILHAAEPRNYAGDVDWPFRQENDFYYLTAIPQTGSTLVLIPGGETVREILFLAPSNPAQETWTGHLLTAAEARAISGIQEVWDARLYPKFLESLIPATRTFFDEQDAARARAGRGSRSVQTEPPPIPVDVKREFSGVIRAVAAKDAALYMITSGPAAEYGREEEFARKLAALAPALAIKDITPILAKMRTVKSPREIDLLKQAVAITAEGFQRAFALAGPGKPEYEIQAQFELTYLRRNAHWGYPCIIGSGANATTLHYETNRDTMTAGDLLLMDSAAEFDGYSADVTRTIPVSGKYSKPQAAIYRLVWDAQQAGIAQLVAGHTGADAVRAVNKVLGPGLFRLGLVTDPDNLQQIRVWSIHGISHGIGLNVHDPGAGELAPGMVVTMEPGLYFRADALDNLAKTPENEKFIAAVRPAFEKYKNIGVRIEDDALITGGKPQVVSSGIPSRLEDVEAAIAKLHKALKSSPLP